MNHVSDIAPNDWNSWASQGQLAPDQIRAEVAKIDWWHEIDLGHGIVTPGRGNRRDFLDFIGLPARLDGMTVLDIGTFDGMMAFEAERRGASRVLAVDHRVPPGFALAHHALGSKVEFIQLEAEELTPENLGRFDLVLFLGVIYHVPNPMLTLQAVSRLVGRTLIVETDSSFYWTDRPVAEFRGSRAAMSDPALNWWVFNAPCLDGMLRAVGFEKVRVVNGPNLPQGRLRQALHKIPSQFSPGTRRMLRSRFPAVFGKEQSSRMVLHAERLDQANPGSAR